MKAPHSKFYRGHFARFWPIPLAATVSCFSSNYATVIRPHPDSNPSYTEDRQLAWPDRTAPNAVSLVARDPQLFQCSPARTHMQHMVRSLQPSLLRLRNREPSHSPLFGTNPDWENFRHAMELGRRQSGLRAKILPCDVAFLTSFQRTDLYRSSATGNPNISRQ